MKSPPERKAPGAGELTGRKRIAAAEYTALALVTNVFGAVFWFFERHRSRLADRRENERAG
jgi:hypothetical protein